MYHCTAEFLARSLNTAAVSIKQFPESQDSSVFDTYDIDKWLVVVSWISGSN
jgi:hypothetical protein